MSKIRLSVDDGCASDVRVAELAEKYGIECTFYWPVEWTGLALSKGYLPLTIDQMRPIADKHIIGSHTITHRLLTDLQPIDAMGEIFDSKEILEGMLGVDIDTFAPPRGYTNPELTEFTLEHYSEQRLTRGKGLVHVHPNSGANNNKPWREAITEDTEELWMHSWELDKYNLWDELEDFLKGLK